MLKKNKKARMPARHGFTLIELLVVIAIIGILASIVLASLNSARRKSRDSRRVADMGQVRLAQELYFDSNRTYVVGATWAALTTGLTGNNCSAAACMVSVPVDPLDTAGSEAGDDYHYASTDAAGAACAAAPCTSYVVKATLEENNLTLLGNDVDGAQGGITGGCGATPEVAGGLYYCIKP